MCPPHRDNPRRPAVASAVRTDAVSTTRRLSRVGGHFATWFRSVPGVTDEDAKTSQRGEQPPNDATSPTIPPPPTINPPPTREHTTVVRGVGESVRDSIQSVARMAPAPVRDLARLGGDNLLAAVLAVLGSATRDGEARQDDGDPTADQDTVTTEMITRGLLGGEGRYTRLEAAEQVGVSLDDARRLWRAVGFAEVGDEERIFTSADVAILGEVAALISAGITDIDGVVSLARPFGHLFSRLAVVQTSFLSDVLGNQITADQLADDPHLPGRVSEQAVQTTRELLPGLERVTVYLWRRHLATEAGRALLPANLTDTDADPLAVGFIDISGFTRLSRDLDSAELTALLDPFEALVLETAVAHGGRVIKNLGDEVMFVADDAAAAAEIALSAVEQLDDDDRLPPVHAGLACGPVLCRGGDVFGDVVNIAARITGLARRGTIRVDEAMADALEPYPQYHVTRRAPRPVRGYLQLRSYRLRRGEAVPPDAE